MATNFRITTAMKNAALDAALDAAQNSGLVRIYDGAQPAGPATAISGQTLLAGHEPSKPEAKAKPGATPLVTRVTFTVLRGPNHMRLAGISPKEVRVGDLVEEVNVTHSSC